jgi:hypothetical protein
VVALLPGSRELLLEGPGAVVEVEAGAVVGLAPKADVGGAEVVGMGGCVVELVAERVVGALPGGVVEVGAPVVASGAVVVV